MTFRAPTMAGLGRSTLAALLFAVLAVLLLSPDWAEAARAGKGMGGARTGGAKYSQSHGRSAQPHSAPKADGPSLVGKTGTTLSGNGTHIPASAKQIKLSQAETGKVLASVGKSAGAAYTSRAARRDAMRDAGIPTSQQPVSQSRNAAGREYSYDMRVPGGGTRRMSVQQQTMDRSHPDQNHWEAGRVKTDPRTGELRYNNHGRPALENDKSKVDY